MNRHPGFPVDEIRGRLLHEALMAEAQVQIPRWCDGIPVTMPPPTEPPHIPQIARTDTGSMRAITITA